MSPIITWGSRRLDAEIVEDQLVYECPFCKNGLSINKEAFTITEQNQQVNTIIPIQCPWDNCEGFYEIIHGHVVEIDAVDIDLNPGSEGMNMDAIYKVWRSRNDRSKMGR